MPVAPVRGGHFHFRCGTIASRRIASDSCTPSIKLEAVRTGHEAPVTAMPDLRVTAPDRVVEGDRLAVLFVGRSKGPAAAAKWCSPIC